MSGRTLLKFVILPLALVTGTAHAQCQQQQGVSGGQVIGTLLGAAAGGLLGSQLGGGTGNKIAIGAGVLAGGLLGNNLGGRMDCADQTAYGSTAQKALETQPSGTTTTWRNPDNGNQAQFTPTRTYQRSDGTYCRDFQQVITVEGRSQTATGTACRQADGSWKIVNG